MSIGVYVLLAAVVLALVIGAQRALTNGRFRGTHAVAGVGADGDDTAAAADPAESLLVDTPWADALGERATLLQFSSAFCAPCRATRRTLHEVAELVPGVAHVEVDAEQHLDVVRRLGIMRTPTTLVLDPGGREITRAAGAPTKAQVLGALDAAVDQ